MTNQETIERLQEENKILLAMLGSACKAENELRVEVKDLQVRIDVLEAMTDEDDLVTGEGTWERAAAHEKAMDLEAYHKGYDLEERQ
jgi:hypothetical protein